MMSSIATSNNFAISQCAKTSLNRRAPDCRIVHIRPKKRGRIRNGGGSNYTEVSESARLGLSDCEGSSRNCYSSSIKAPCSVLDEEGDLVLESKILTFMKGSENRKAFPTKQQLIDAGRMDLVKAIMKQGGWLTLGWDLDDVSSSVLALHYRRINGALPCSNGSASEEMFHSSRPASSSGRPLSPEGSTDEITGSNDVRENDTPSFNNYNICQPYSTQMSGDPESSKQVDANKMRINGFTDKSQESLSPESWRTWSLQRAGESSLEFEVGEIHPTRTYEDIAIDNIQSADCHPHEDRESNSNEKLDIDDIRSRLQHMESELNCIFHALNLGDNGTSGHIISTGDKFEADGIQIALRSMHVRMTVLEGKIALAVIDCRKAKREKQKRMKNARKELERLRTVRIVWHNSGSEVLLAGSYDGWTSQRKMEKGNSGHFRLYLKLYPGRYEIKFIVDGIWTIDPCQPVMHNNGYDNNLLIIT